MLDSIVSAGCYYETINLFHGDIRPINIVLTEEGFIKIGD